MTEIHRDEIMRIDERRCVPLKDIPEMNDGQRIWLEVFAQVNKGYYHKETGKFVIAKECKDGKTTLFLGMGKKAHDWQFVMSV